MKWRKYERLVEYDLITLEELERTITRYPISSISRLREDMEENLAAEERFGRQTLYVIKLVPPDRQGQLPNLRVQSRRDLEGLESFVRRHSLTRASEAWYCRTPVDEDIFSVAGRILFARDEFRNSQVVEQVWRCSPRLIETFGPKFAFPYARASRCSWGWRFNIEIVYSPDPERELTQRLEFINSLQTMERARDKIEIFISDVFYRSALRSVSLEYKIVGSHFSVIDWDTENDRAVLNT
jgi:hypothetical protein